MRCTKLKRGQRRQAVTHRRAGAGFRRLCRRGGSAATRRCAPPGRSRRHRRGTGRPRSRSGDGGAVVRVREGSWSTPGKATRSTAIHVDHLAPALVDLDHQVVPPASAVADGFARGRPGRRRGVGTGRSCVRNCTFHKGPGASSLPSSLSLDAVDPSSEGSCGPCPPGRPAGSSPRRGYDQCGPQARRATGRTSWRSCGWRPRRLHDVYCPPRSPMRNFHRFSGSSARSCSAALLVPADVEKRPTMRVPSSASNCRTADVLVALRPHRLQGRNLHTTSTSS